MVGVTGLKLQHLGDETHSRKSSCLLSSYWTLGTANAVLRCFIATGREWRQLPLQSLLAETSLQEITVDKDH